MQPICWNWLNKEDGEVMFDAAYLLELGTFQGY